MRLSICLLLACAVIATLAQNLITINSEGLLPEGVDYSSVHSRLYVSSISKGGVYTVSDSGTVSLFSNAEGKTVSVAGIHVDDQRELIYLCNTGAVTPTPTSNGSVVAVSQRDGSVKFVGSFDDLGKDNRAPKFINDVVPDAQGNLYVTDSNQGAIYKYDVKARKTSVFVQDPVLAPQDGMSPGANGIEYYKLFGQEYLLVGRSGKTVKDSGLFRISFKNSSLIERVRYIVPEGVKTPTGLDGLFFEPKNNRRLYLVDGNQNMVYTLESRNHWKSAVVTKSLDTKTTPTTLTFVGSPYNQVFVISLNGFGPGPYFIEKLSVPYKAKKHN